MNKIKFLVKAFGNAKILGRVVSVDSCIFLVAENPIYIIEYFEKK